MENTNVEKLNKSQINTQWLIYLIVWFFFWAFWIHRFVAWKIGSGIWMLALQVIWWLTVVFLIWFLFLWAAWIWWLVDGIIILMGKFKEKNGEVIEIKVAKK